MSNDDADAFSQYFHQISHLQFPAGEELASTYTLDFEQWWRIPRPNINEW